MLWLYLKYLNNSYIKTNKVPYVNFKNIKIKFRLVITSRTSAALTLLKSPMAQKTWSKEQVGFKYFNVNLSIFIFNFENMFKLTNIKLDSLYKYYYWMELINKNTCYASSVVLILKYTTVNFDINYESNLYL